MRIKTLTHEGRVLKAPVLHLAHDFPVDKVCQKCKSEVVLESYHDLKLSIDREYGMDQLYWSCPACGAYNKYTDEWRLIKAWRDLTNYKDYAWLNIVVFMVVVALLFLGLSYAYG